MMPWRKKGIFLAPCVNTRFEGGDAVNCKTAVVIFCLLALLPALPAAAEPYWDGVSSTYEDVGAVGRWGEIYTGEKLFGDACSGGWECFSGVCVWTPNGHICSRQCEQGCPEGWECRVCADWCPFAPLADVCLVPCTPECSGKQCGDDGCGGSCGQCEVGTKCGDSGSCDPCTSTCDERICGPDGCGGSCGDCDDGFLCTSDGLCTDSGVPAGDGADADEMKSSSSCSAAPSGQPYLLAMLFLLMLCLLAVRRRSA